MNSQAVELLGPQVFLFPGTVPGWLVCSTWYHFSSPEARKAKLSSRWLSHFSVSRERKGPTAAPSPRFD